jgi:transcriptional regulator GlxA family with amidase domain
MPQLSYADLDQTLAGQEPELVVVPAMWDVGSSAQRPVADWLRRHGPGVGTLMSVCDGAEVLADAGFLDGRRATANWANLAKWQRRHPDTEWVRGRRYVEDGNVLTSAGVTSGTAAALHVVRRYVGEAAGDRLADQIGYPDTRTGDEPEIPADRLSASDRALYVLGGAYSWGDKPKVGVVLSSGPSEIELASAFDVYPGPAFTSTTTSLGADGSTAPVRSEHGLLFIPRHGLSDAPPLDRLVVPGEDARSAVGPAVASWASTRGLDLEFVHADAGDGFPFDGALGSLARNTNAPLAGFTARLLEYPTSHLELVGAGWPVGWLFRPLAAGLVGLLAVAGLDRLVLVPALRRRRGPTPPPGPESPVPAATAVGGPR